MIMIMLIGPQGAGKTTLANIIRKQLSKSHKVCIVKLIDYTILHHTYLGILRVLAKKSSNRIVFMRLSPLYVFLHFIGFIVSKIKFMLLSSTRKCHVFIEDEGYIFKELADFYFIMGVTGALENKFVKHIAKTFLRFLLKAAFKGIHKYIVVYIDTPYATLLQRYITSRKHIEPEAYVNFQRFVYKMMSPHIITYLKDFCLYIYTKNVDTMSLTHIANFVISAFRVSQN